MKEMVLGNVDTADSSCRGARVRNNYRMPLTRRNTAGGKDAGHPW